MVDNITKPATLPQLIQSVDVRNMFGGRSDMWLWRRIKDGTLPPPIVIAGRRYWRFDEIVAIINNLPTA